jgi:regulator of sigma E protease
VNAASVPDQDALQQMSPAERSVSFPHKTVAQRAAVVAAGPIANFLLAILVFAALFYANGRHVLAPRVDQVQAGTAAERAGFKAEDVIRSINGRAIESFSDMQRIVSASAGDPLTIVVDRNGEAVTLEAVPDTREQVTPFGTQRIGLLGLQASRNPDDVKHVTYGLLQSVRLGAWETWYVVERTFGYLGKLVVGRESIDQLSGPLRIAEVSGKVASAGGSGALISLVAGAVRLDRADQPFPDSPSRRRPSPVLRHRGAARAAR